HPELCSLETASAHHIHSNYIDSDPATGTIAKALTTAAYGPAKPETTSGETNKVGWATLIPVVDDTTGKPYVNTRGKNHGCNQYLPRLHRDLTEYAGPAMARMTASVGNDESLGVDVTGLDPKPGDPANPAYAGKMWTRQDGTAFVDVATPAVGAGAGGVVMTQTQDPGQYLTRLNASSTTSGNLTTVKMRLLNAATRYLGVYLQFFNDVKPDTALTLTDIPEYNDGSILAGHDNGNDLTDTMFVGMLGSEYTVMAIPVGPAFLMPAFKLPAGVTSVRVLMSGLGTGANAYPGTLLRGELMTGFISYGITAFMCALGAATALKVIIDTSVTPVMSFISNEFVALIGSGVSDTDPNSWQFWIAQILGLAKSVANFVSGRKGGEYLTKLLTSMIAADAAGAAEDSIPLAGWVMLGISIAVGVTSLAETSIEVALSPKTYVWDLSFTHEVAVTLTPDSQRGGGSFPAAATHCIVTATFGDALPHKQTFSLNGVDLRKPIVVAFPGVPLGGSINVSVAFVQQAIAGQTNILLGKGNTGNLPNVPLVAPAIEITQLEFPLGPTTIYQHQQKTALTAAGVHYWSRSAAAPTSTQLACGEAGSMCGLNSISVRQGTLAARGYVGYAWQAQNLDSSVAPGCSSGGGGQFDQMANVDTGADASIGYAVTTCGYETPGVQLAYDLLSTGARNFFIDTSGGGNGAWHLRQVVLDGTPGFDRGAGQSWGVFNFLPDVLLLHPAGYVVSISSDNHKMETLRLPLKPLADAGAAETLLAQTHCGLGTRPGRLTQPLTADVTADGTIIVLENGDPSATPPVPTRLQAITVGGNPKKHFTGQTGSADSSYFLVLTETQAADGWTLLDVAVEYTGAIYVLARGSDHKCRLDIYLHDQAGTKPLCSTPGLNAGKLTVDFWRGVYALNNEVIQRDDNVAPRLTEPSISLWEPCNVGQTCR
ncbi:MAG: hypothetical protein ABI277_15120, partial [Burkholderiaceae bacterium]